MSRMTFSPIVTIKNDAIQVLLMVVKEKHPAGAQHAPDFKQHSLEILYMFQYIDADDNVEDAVGKG